MKGKSTDQPSTTTTAITTTIIPLTPSISSIPSKYRYFNAFIMILTALCNSMMVQSLSTINNQITHYFPGTSAPMVSACALQFMMIHPLVSLFANYILDRKGLKLGISINCTIVIIGMAIRMLVGFGFYWIMIGNAIIAAGNIFVLNCPARFSSVWFKPQERLLITSLIVFANAISGGVGSIFSPKFVPDNLSPEQGREKVQAYVNFQAMLIGGVMAFNLIFFKGKKTSKSSQNIKNNPLLQQSLLESQDQLKKQSQSQSQSQSSSKLIFNQNHNNESLYQHNRTEEIDKMPYIQVLKTLLTNKNYLLIFPTLMIVLSILNCFATNVQLYIVPFGFNSKDSANFTLINVVSGLIGALISSSIIKKTKRYKLVILIQLSSTIVVSLLLLMSLYLKSIVLVSICVSLFGFFVYPLMPAIIQYACQAMYPIKQATVQGIMLGGGQLFSFVIGLVQAEIMQAKTKQSAIISLLINSFFYGVAILLFSFSKQDLKRLKENSKNK